ncbi:MAG: response regulator receiver modulated diguanylate cyclase [Acidobacteria bacterium]|nr:response regulator receiver modulated diguanylate cyclase [Acidobacteriota bacterium]
MPEQSAFKVAIVDDDAAIRRLVRLFLQRAGYETLECTTGEEARRRLVAEPWDLAILDRRLPDLDGVLLCHELKSNPDFRARYIIMLTGETEQEDKIQGLELGADDYITKPFQYPELMARIRAGKRIVDLQKELMETNRRLELLSITDGLTKLNNHRYFQDELLRAFEESSRYQRPLSLAMIDIDFFKKINDTHGHAIGDDVLKAVSNLFRESIRSTDLVARYGGEEFAVMMPETELDDAITFAEKIRALVAENAIDTQVGPVPATVSIGVASVPFTRVRGPKDLIVAADKALYRAKKAGRNQVHAEKRRDSGRATKKTAPAAKAS